MKHSLLLSLLLSHMLNFCAPAQQHNSLASLPDQSVIMAEISIGELIDKITILEIKKEEIKDEAKLRNVTKELDSLNATRMKQIPNSRELERLKAELKVVNKKLWDIEDALRDKERARTFDKEFIELSRSVYYTNDQRCKIKRQINDLLGSRLVEEKSYRDYAVPATA